MAKTTKQLAVGGKAQTPYQATLAAADATYNLPVNWFNGMARIGEEQGWKIDNSNSATWQKIAQLANSGNTQAAIDLANQLSAAGQFGGYWGDDGKYYGFAQGYSGGANASMQPVIGNQILTPKGLEAENTTHWLTPDGKVLKYGQGGILTNNGETWGTTQENPYELTGRWYTENQPIYGDIRDTTFTAWAQQQGWSPAETQQHMGESGAFTNPALNTLEGNLLRLQELQANPNADPAAIAAVQAQIQNQGGSTIYQQMLSQTGNSGGASGGTSGGASGGAYPAQQSAVSTQQYIAAPEAYDPNSSKAMQDFNATYGIGTTPQWDGGTYNALDNQMYKDYLEWLEKNQAPEYAGDPYQAQRDAALEAYGQKWGGSQYQPMRDQHLQNAANMKWDYNPDTDPVWQAYQKQYRREGQRATEDTLGRVAGMTGGMPSSYAVTAAGQAGNYYASQLSDKLPELYQQAYNRYLQEYQRQLGLSDAYAQFDNTEYTRWLQGQQRNLDLANAYNQYGLQDYEKYRDSVNDYNNNLKTRYQMALDNIDLERGDWERGYGLFQDQLGQYNKDRDFYYGTAMDDIANSRQAAEDQYKRYLDEVAQQNYINERLQYLKEYADSQNWKEREYEQYLREYGDKLSQQEREWIYKQMQDANDQALDLAKLGAQYGDYSGLNGLGIDTSSMNPKEVAYASDGSTYKFNTQDALYFVQNAPNGTAGNPTTMKGSDGSIWKKDEYGNVTITATNGKTFTYSNNGTPAVTGSGEYYSDGGGGGNGSHLEALKQSGATTYSEALDFLMTQRGLTYNAANSMAKDYINGLSVDGDTGHKYSDDDVSRAWDIINGKYPNANQAAVTWAQQVLNETSGLQFDNSGIVAEENQGAGYRNLVSNLNSMVANYASRDEIFETIDKQPGLTDAQREALKNQYYNQSDNAPNNGRYHSGKKPMSTGYNAAEKEALMMYSRGESMQNIAKYLMGQIDTSKIHVYESDIILNRIAQQTGGVAPASN